MTKGSGSLWPLLLRRVQFTWRRETVGQVMSSGVDFSVEAMKQSALNAYT